MEAGRRTAEGVGRTVKRGARTNDVIQFGGAGNGPRKGFGNQASWPGEAFNCVRLQRIYLKKRTRSFLVLFPCLVRMRVTKVCRCGRCPSDSPRFFTSDAHRKAPPPLISHTAARSPPTERRVFTRVLCDTRRFRPRLVRASLASLHRNLARYPRTLQTFLWFSRLHLTRRRPFAGTGALLPLHATSAGDG